MNGTLKRAAEWLEARAIVEAAGLQPYEKPASKSWDALRACNLLLRHVARDKPVLDAGGSPNYSYISSWLAHYGFTVEVINRELPSETDTHGGRVRFRRGDVTRTEYSDGTFGAITCLSVVEHGVPLDPFFAEMARLLAPGGYLIISTDFWHVPVDTLGQSAFGSPVRIFVPRDIDEMIALAREHRLHATGVVDYRCDAQVVRWLGLDFTFIDFALRRWPN